MPMSANTESPRASCSYTARYDSTGRNGLLKPMAGDHCASSCLMSAARYGGTGAASASYWSLNERPIAVSPTYRSGAGFPLLRVAGNDVPTYPVINSISFGGDVHVLPLELGPSSTDAS